ncbi:MAG: alkaline shock response membrane anchor protein AmaP [Candidatus Omnitrophica bacterium]|nr:alkaline shock response membrane anchor protein AmaP [Candidatus Omnitrophota bacterium]MCB9720728.1 alkaline shock response membrane anchor protein AmaP [Candidatus Omnitrophota bacterium]
MNFLKRFGLAYFVTFTVFVCLFLFITAQGFRIDVYGITLGWNYIDLVNYLQFMFSNDHLRNFTISLSVTLICLNWFFYCVIASGVRRDRVISFDNPNGRVSVSLFALEDLVKRTILQFDEIKDNKPVIHVKSRVLRVRVPIILKSDVQIPEVTSRVQAEVLKKIRDTIGGSQKIDIAVYVNKIQQKRSKPPAPRPAPVKPAPAVRPPEKTEATGPGTDKPDGPVVPFQGPRA